MDLKSLLETLDKNMRVKCYVFYFNEEREKVENIVFQKGVFYRLEKDGLVLFNPIRAIQTLDKIMKKDYKLLGTGVYGKDLELSKIYKGGVAV